MKTVEFLLISILNSASLVYTAQVLPIYEFFQFTTNILGKCSQWKFCFREMQSWKVNGYKSQVEISFDTCNENNLKLTIKFNETLSSMLRNIEILKTLQTLAVRNNDDKSFIIKLYLE